MTLKPPTETTPNNPGWQTLLADVITDSTELSNLLELSTDTLTNSIRASQDFALRVPRAFVARMQKNNLQDPLLQQVLPIAAELQIIPGYTRNPLQEKRANPLPGLLHKYFGRVLLLVAGGCAIHCRYCFRRHFAYAENAPGKAEYAAILDYIRSDSSIHEVIYSGGDPLLAQDHVLASLTQDIANIPHVTTLRIHTRLPIVIPERITAELLYWFTSTRLQPVMVLHCNHANEIDNSVIDALSRLRQANVTLLNQAVLLKGVNDDVDALINLSKRLFATGVLPYYLNLLDKVHGAAHFAVSAARARRLVGAMISALPGYLVPKLVQEKSGMPAKCPLLPTILHRD